MTKFIRFMQPLLLVLICGPAFGDDRDVVISELQEQIARLADRLSALEGKAESKQACCALQKTRAERFSFSGDVRYRYENIDDDRRATTRDRSRVRARAAMVAQINDDFEMGIGVASGGDDPRSSNQTLGNGGSTKDLRLDLAYIGWQLTDSVSIVAGKMKNPFHRAGKHPLLWDSDYRPEGVAIKYDNARGFYITGAVNLLESDNQSSNGDAETGWGVQSGIKHMLGEHAQLHAGGSYYHYGIAGSMPFYDNKSFGNTLDINGAFKYDYEVIEAFAELSFDVFDLPVSVFANVMNNQDASDHNMGWAFGANVGTTSAKGSWEFGYRYQDFEADAWFGLPSDSDFGGGGADTQGHVIKAGYALNNNSALKLTYILSEYGEVSRGMSFDYDRLQMDLSLKF